MINGNGYVEAAVFDDLVALLKSKSKVLDKKTISLGVLNLEIDEQTKRTLEEEIEQKHKAQIKEFAEKGVQVSNNNDVRIVIEDEKEKEKEKEKPKDDKTIDGADDLII